MNTPCIDAYSYTPSNPRSNTPHTLLAHSQSSLEYISSAGLGVFISYLDELEDREGQLVFSNLSEEVFDVFELLGLSRLVKIVPEANAAGALFQS